MEKCREAVFEENTTVSQILEEDRMTKEDQDFSEEDDSEDEWEKHLYENITQESVAVIQMMQWKVLMT